MTSEDTLLEAESHGLIATDGEEVRLAHPLYGEAVRTRLPPLRARSLRLQLVEVLERRDRVRLRRRAEGGSAPPRRGRRVCRRSSHFTARERRTAPAIPISAPSSPHSPAPRPTWPPGCCWPSRTRCATDTRRRRRPWPRSSALAPGDRERPRLSQPAALAVSLGAAAHGRYRRAARSRRYLVARTRVAAVHRPDPRHLRRAARRVRLTARPHRRAQAIPGSPTRPDAALAAMQTISAFLSGQGDTAAAAAFAARPSVPLRDFADAAALATLSLIALETGHRWDEVEQYMSGVVHDAVRAHDHAAAGLSAFTLARLHFLRARYRDAARWLAEAEIHFRQQDPFNVMLSVRALRVGIACFTGDFDGTMAALDRLRAFCESHAAAARATCARSPRGRLGACACATPPTRAVSCSRTRRRSRTRCWAWRPSSRTTRSEPERRPRRSSSEWRRAASHGWSRPTPSTARRRPRATALR